MTLATYVEAISFKMMLLPGALIRGNILSSSGYHHHILCAIVCKFEKGKVTLYKMPEVVSCKLLPQ